MRNLPWPSTEQCDAFVKHLCGARRWDEQLSLVSRTDFVLFLSEDAGEGIDGDRHSSFSTPEEYRKLFGHLDFAWRTHRTENYTTDAGREVEPDDNLIAIAGFNLSPFCSNNPDAAAVICSLWGEDAAESQWYEDRAHLPSALRRAVLELSELFSEVDHAYSELTPDEAFAVADPEHAAMSEAEESTILLSDRVLRYWQRKRAFDARFAALHDPEVAAVKKALSKLQVTLNSGR